MSPASLPARLRAHVWPVIFAAVAMTPALTLLLLALDQGRSHDWIEWVAIIPVATILCFVTSLVLVALLGPPASLALESQGWNTGVAHAVSGVSLALFLFASYVIGAWFLDDPGPFSLSLPQQVAHMGVTRAILRGLLCAGGLATCGAIAGYAYWFRLSQAERQQRRDLNPSQSGDP